MNSTLVSKEGSIFKFEMSFAPAEFEEALNDAYKATRDRYSVDGFRKGKAPRKIIERYYGEETFYGEALNAMFDKGYYDALTELNIEPIDQPSTELGKINKDENIVVKVAVEGFPEVEIKDYKGVEIDNIVSTIGDKEVEEEMKKAQQSQARLETVEGRATKEGDTAVIDFVGSVDGVEFEGGAGENFELKLGSGQFIPGFEEQLIGKETGSEVKVEVTFPEEYHSEELAGKAAIFETKINEIKEELLPEIDDELASEVSEFETLEELKKDVQEKLQKEAEDRNDSIMRNAAFEAVFEKNPIEAPAVMVENELSNVVYEINQQLQMQGISLDDYIKWTGKSMEEVREESRPEAEKRIKSRIILRNIIRIENIDATEEEVEAEIADFGAKYGQTAEQVKAAVGINSRYFKEDVQTKKALDLVYDNAVKGEPMERIDG
ncbi:MAG: trigger factor [Clostridiales bacterium]|nr:trigger factor [Clostridiales bacterium]